MFVFGKPDIGQDPNRNQSKNNQNFKIAQAIKIYLSKYIFYLKWS